MQPKLLTNDLSISPQISTNDIAEIKAAGFKSIICNRPDGEAFFGQPAFKDIEAVAKAAGLSVSYQPIYPGRMTESDAVVFAGSLHAMPKPILAYCRTGTRSATLWSQVKAKGLVSAS